MMPPEIAEALRRATRDRDIEDAWADAARARKSENKAWAIAIIATIALVVTTLTAGCRVTMPPTPTTIPRLL